MPSSVNLKIIFAPHWTQCYFPSTMKNSKRGLTPMFGVVPIMWTPWSDENQSNLGPKIEDLTPLSFNFVRD